MSEIRKETMRWVKFYSPNILCADTWTEDVTGDDPNEVVWPERAYAFRMYYRVDVYIDGERFKGDNQGGGVTYYHPDSKVESIDEVRARNNPEDSTLLGNMECNGWSHIIWTRWGNWPQPYESDTVVVLKG